MDWFTNNCVFFNILILSFEVKNYLVTDANIIFQ